ncbi:MAG: hypothetical protein Kow0037_23780 [Calditrichia bacterium]
MSKNRISVYYSTVGKKLFIGITGLSLFGFIVIHLLGNLTLFSADGNLLNGYAHKLESLGALLYVAELILLVAFLFHMILAVTETLKNRRARGGQKYVVSHSAGGASKKTLASSTMIYTGIVIILFTIFHLITFKFGPGVAEGYSVVKNGETVRDLHRLVVESFQNEWLVLGYVLVMLFLGFHLRHGFWSAFQSLGIAHPKLTPFFYSLGAILAVLLAGGFLVLPVYIYFAF